MSILDSINGISLKQRKLKEDMESIKDSVSLNTNSIDKASITEQSKKFIRLPSVNITIDMSGMSKDISKKGTLTYNEKILDDFGNVTSTNTFTSYVKMKWQGSSSVYLPKKNYSIKLYTDAEESNKDYRIIKEGWSSTNKFVLKANYIDHTHARNIVCARVWGEIVKSRNTTNGSLNNGDANLIGLLNGGAIEGFPVRVYINGEYTGLYTWNMPKDEIMFGMGSREHEGFLADEENASRGELSAPPVFDETDFTIEYCSTDDEQWLKDSFTALYNVIQIADDNTFKTQLATVMDIDSVIDYYLFIFYMGLSDNFARNSLLGTFDGTKWFMSAYDMDNCFGIDFTSKLSNSPNEFGLSTIDRNKLIRRIRLLFPNEVKARYTYLRSNILNLNNLVDKLQNFTWTIPQYLYLQDGILQPLMGSTGIADINQIVTWMQVREKYVDGIINQ